MPYKDPVRKSEYNKSYNKERYHRARQEWFKHHPCYVCGGTENLQLSTKAEIPHRVFHLGQERREALLKGCKSLCKECWWKKELNRRHAKPLPRKNGHGTWKYRQGCRCEFCRYAHKMDERRSRHRQTPAS